MNKISIEYGKEEIHADPAIFELIEKTVNQVLEDQKIECDVDIAVTLTDNEDIARINKDYRKIDKPTDVLSFPLLDFETPGAIWAQPEDFEDGRLLLGDIVISVDKAESQAAEYGHSVEREYAFLTAHSVLHLLGYDHITPEEEAVMIEKQEKALGQLGLTR